MTQIPKEGPEVLDLIPDCFAWHVKSCASSGEGPRCMRAPASFIRNGLQFLIALYILLATPVGCPEGPSTQ